MPSTERLATILAPVARAIHPPEAIRRMKRAEAAIADDGSLSDYAVNTAQSPQILTWFISGTLAVANTQGPQFRVPFDGILLRLDLQVKTAPTGADLRVRIRSNTHVITTVTINAGDTTGGLVLNRAVNAGDVLTIDITQIGSGTAGANLSACASIREER